MDFFGTFRGARFREVPFPVVELRGDFAQDQAEHACPDRDGARMEGTGRAPRRFSAQIPFRNVLLPGPGETWTRGTLYPEGYRRFLAAMDDRSTGELVHPEWGELQVKPTRWTTLVRADRRDGADVEASWIESTETEGESDALLVDHAPAMAFEAARAIDMRLRQAPALAKAQDPSFEANFEEAIRAILTPVDQAWLAGNRALAPIGRVLARLRAVQGAIERLANVQDWPALRSIEVLRAALYDLRDRASFVVSPKVRVFTVDAATTVPALAVRLGVSPIELLALNPPLGGQRVVSAGQTIRYLAR